MPSSPPPSQGGLGGTTIPRKLPTPKASSKSRLNDEQYTTAVKERKEELVRKYHQSLAWLLFCGRVTPGGFARHSFPI